MSWLSLLAGRSGRRWMPVSNTDESDAAATDDLMRMADGYYDDNQTGGRDADPAVYRSISVEPVFHHLYTSSHTNSSRSSASFVTTDPPQSESLSKVLCLYGRKKLTFPQKRWVHVLVSIFVILLFVGLCVGLGVYSLLFYYPDKLVIDKSVKSFSIPNHEAYRHFEAMMLARKDSSNLGRFHRDTSRSSNKHLRSKRDVLRAKENKMLQKTRSVLRELGHKDIGFSNRKPESIIFKPTEGFSLGSAINSVLKRIKRATQTIDCYHDYQSVARWKMHVIYLAHGDNSKNMFTKDRLQTVHEIEKKIIQHPDFHKFCLRDPRIQSVVPSVQNMNGCVPLNSLLTYFYPSKDAGGTVYYDGMGANLVDIDSALKLAMTQDTFYYYVDDKINKTFQESHLLRSEVLFGAPLQGYNCVNELRKDQDEKFKDFVVTYINLLSKSSTDKVSVLYGGNEIFDYEVSSSFWSDVRLAVISLVAICVIMLVLSLSLYLTVIGIIIIGVSFPISLFFYRVAFGINALGILNGAAAFVIIGIGVDDVFVYMNIYRQADHMKDPAKRIWYTVKTAGVATFFTSFTTAAAFAANIASSIPAVYEFGLFMSLIVSSCWVSVFVLMPPTLYLHACYIEPIEQLLLSCFSCIGSQEGSSNSSTVHHYDQQQGNGYNLYEDDLPMLDVEGIDNGTSQNYQDDECMDDDDMLLMDDPNSPPSEGQLQFNGITTGNDQIGEMEVGEVEPVSTDDNNMCLGLLLQKMMILLTDRVVIRGRFIFMGFFAAVLITSCFLMAQLQPSAHPPQLFRPDTNIQQLLDLKANFTMIDTLHCDRCSGIYKAIPGKVDQTEHLQGNTPHPQETSSHLPYHYWTSGGSISTTLSPRHSQIPNTDSISGLPSSLLNVGNDTKYLPLKATGIGMYQVFSELLASSSSGSPQVSKRPASDSPRPLPSVSVAAATSQQQTSTSQQQTATSQQPTATSQHHHDHGVQPATTRWTPTVSAIPRTSHPDPGSHGTSSSVDENFNACKGQSCGNLKDRPVLESGATVYVVFGIKGVDRSHEDIGHVLDQFQGKTIFDTKFGDTFNLQFHELPYLKELCQVCSIISNKTDLVKPGSAQCLPTGMSSLLTKLSKIPECHNLPGSLSIYQHQAPAHVQGGVDRQNRLMWLAFAFESTTSEGQAYFEAYKQYEKWEQLISDIKRNVLSPDSPLHSMFQTSEFWTKVLMEVVAVNSAIYGLVLSMIICVMAVAVFTGHVVLLLIVVVTIIAMICCVVGVFYLAGWEMGAVEAVSLSILVGSSVDYCVHIVEGYILAGKKMPLQYINSQSAADVRKQRTSQAIRHIGVAIVCSAVTTIIAAVPLTQTYIQPFAKFGSILLINTTVSMVMTLTLAVALLATFGPAGYRGGWKAHLIAFASVAGLVGLVVLGLYIATTQGVTIPGPSGNPLFS
ncbi:hypothetical protein BsWGS_26821 [Bradybaena similaris]